MRATGLVFLLMAGALAAQEPGGTVEKLAPYYPTPETIVDKMLELGGLRAGEKMYDLGSGDGRIVILAASKYHANAIGVEYDPDLVRQSDAKIRKLKLLDTAKIIHGDIFAQNYSNADLITVYLLPSSNDKVRPMLERQLKKGARVVAHDFEFRGWTPVRTETIEDDGEGRSHTLFLYQR
ncbi:MAG: class I SAM-dependent methyltransferase [Acidobacteriota bacterium]|nr:class I SAM-dependent methyltransferase [Acidobacteriota bacterium]